MFTGLVETSGHIKSLRKTSGGITMALRPVSDFSVNTGDSVAVNGVCLTVTGRGGNLSFDVSPVTLRHTNL